MNIDQIYGYKQPEIADYISRSYNLFARDIETDKNFTLSDDEVSELFNELILMYMRDTMSYDEWTRITKILTN